MFLYSSHFKFNFCSLTTLPSFNLYLFLFKSCCMFRIFCLLICCCTGSNARCCRD
uniref:Uncharacterized protein n=1 Tax=Arundo donax TaxID=35708 RepID=A0A0A9EEH5_ARUDO